MKKAFLMAMILCIFTSVIFGNVLTKEINFNKDDLIFQKSGKYDIIKIKGGNFKRIPGEPLISYKTIFLSVPEGFHPESIKIINTTSTPLPGTFSLFPSQKPVPLMSGQKGDTPDFIEMEESVNRSSKSYPETIAESTKPGYLAGHCIYGIKVFPISYTPSTGKVIFNHSIQIQITYTLDGKRPIQFNHRNIKSEKQFQDMIKALVLNPEEVEFNSKGLIKDSPNSKSDVPDNITPSLSPGDVDYVIITDPTYETDFQPLADWKTKKGVPTQIITTDWLYTNYTGVDNPEKIRNFIIDAYSNWGTQWILLGGDTDIIPERPAYAMTSGAGYYIDEDDIPCDLYFSDLDGDWNADGDGIYGELDDNIDLYPDVYVGRAPVDSVSEVQAFVNKVLNYEKGPELDYQLRTSFIGAYLDAIPTDGGIAKDTIDTESFPARFDPISKFYENNSTLTYSNVMNALNEGQNLFNHNDHCNEYIIGLGPDDLTRADMDSLTNTNRYTVFYSIGCWPAALDRDAIAEHFVVNPDGGGFFVGNSRYGWYSPGNPGNGPSDLYDNEFWKSVFHKDIYHIGATLADSKITYIPDAQWENTERWIQYCLNLLGDPEMPIHTDVLETLAVTHPAQVTIGSVPVNVHVERDGTAFENALVCIQGDDTYHYGFTDASGNITLTSTEIGPGTLNITVTGYNSLPYESTITVIATGPFVNVFNSTIDDDSTPPSSGNNDGFANPEETIELVIILKNFGVDSATGITVSLSTADTYCNITSNSTSCSDLSPGATSVCLSNFVVEILSICPENHTITFDLAIVSNEDNWSDKILKTVVFPVLEYQTHVVDDDSTAPSVGNGDGVISPNETIEMPITIINNGHGPANVVSATMSTGDSYITIINGSSNFGDIPGQDTTVSQTAYLFSVSNTTPDSHPITFDLLMIDSEGDTWTDSFTVYCEYVPDISVNPTLFNKTLNEGESETDTLTIFNTGFIPLDFSILDSQGEITGFLLTKKPEKISIECYPGTNNRTHVKVIAIGDLVGSFSTSAEDNQALGLTFDGENFWVSGAGNETNPNYIYKYDRDGNFISSFQQTTSSTWGWRDLAWDGTYLYASDGTQVDVIDPVTESVVRTFSPSTGLSVHRGMCYDGQYLWSADWDSTIYQFDLNGNVVNSFPNTRFIYGLGWDDESVGGPFLWATAQDGPNQDTIYKIDPNTGDTVESFMGFGNGCAGCTFVNWNGKGTVWDVDQTGGVVNGMETSTLDANWLTETPDSGTIPIASSTELEILFDATNLIGGNYTANIIIASNDPDENPTIIPVTLTVIGFPNMEYHSNVVDDDNIGSSSGNGDGIISPDETIEMPITIRNKGSEVATGVTATISTTDPFVNLTNDTSSFGDIPKFSNAASQSAYLFTVSNTTPDSHPIIFDILISDSIGNTWTDSFTVYCEYVSDIAVNPISFSKSLTEGATTTDILTINNTGLADLQYSIFEEDLGFTYQPPSINDLLKYPTFSGTPKEALTYYHEDNVKFFSYDEKMKDQVLSSGGPDTFGYRWKDSDDPGGPTYSWVDITGTGTEITGLGDDDNVGPFNIGFDFSFYGNTFNTFRFSTNGFISFDSTLSAYSNVSIPNSADPDNLIAVFWDDFDFSGGGTAYYQSNGVDTLVVSYINVPRLSDGGSLTFQIILRRTGEIILQYNTLSGTLNSCTVGIENNDGSDGLEMVYNADYLHNDMAISLCTGVDWLEESSTSGTISAGNSEDITITFDATSLPGGDYSANIVINNNDPDENPTTIPVSLHVIGIPNIAYNSNSIDDDNSGSSSGNGDGVISPNETIEMPIILENIGTDSTTGITATLSTVDPLISVTSDYAEFGDLSKGATIESQTSYVFTVDGSTPDSHPITFDLLISDSVGNTWTDSFVAYVEFVPDINVAPIEFNKSLAMGSTTTDILVINNTGLAELTYGISENDRGTLMKTITMEELLKYPKYPATPQTELKYIHDYQPKTLYSEIQNPPEILGFGGPDTFGYTWKDSDEADGPNYNWIDITSTGTEITGLGDETNVGPFNIGFDFAFYGNTYNTFRFTSNGWITFTEESNTYTNSSIPGSGVPNNIIAPFWDDLSFSSQGNAYYYSNGVDTLVISYIDVERFSDGGSLTFQIIMKKTGQIFFQYQTLTGTLDSCTIGIENADGSDGLEVVYNAAYIHNNMAISIGKGVDWLDETPKFGTVNAGNFENITVTFDATSLTEGTYLADLIITNNDPDEDPVTIPVTLNVFEENPPADVTDLTVIGTSYNYITLEWTVPGDDAWGGTAANYDFRYSESQIVTMDDFNAATQCTDEPEPVTADGTKKQSYTIADLNFGTTYYFAMRTKDDSNNWSGISNTASGVTGVIYASGSKTESFDPGDGYHIVSWMVSIYAKNSSIESLTGITATVVNSDTWVNVIDNSITFPDMSATSEAISDDTLEFDLTNRPGDPGSPVNYIMVWFNFSYTKSLGKTEVSIPVKLKIPEVKLNPPQNLQAVQIGEKVKLVWQNDNTQVNGYNIYKYSNNNKWVKLNKKIITKRVFKDTDVKDGKGYRYKATSCYEGLESGYSNVAKIKVKINYTDLDKLLTFPNPARDKVIFNKLPKDAKIIIYTLNGEEVITLYANGKNQVEWRLLNKARKKVSAGMYFYVITSSGGAKKGKIAVIK